MAHLCSIDFGTDVVSEAQYAPICSGTASAQLHRRNGCRCRQARQADHVGDDPEGTPVRYMRSIFIPGEDKCYCLFEGESADTVRQANERAELPVKSISEAWSITTVEIT